MRKTNAEGLRLIKQWEGKHLRAYQGAADRTGLLTIGYGHTSAAGAPVVTEGMVITDAEAEQILIRDLAKVEADVERLVKVPLNDNQFAVLVSFTFNLGAGALAGSTLLRKLNAGDYDAIPAELMKWVNSAGKRRQGLVNRRAAEAGLWAKGQFVASQYVEPEPDNSAVAFKPEVVGPAVASAGGVLSALNGIGGPVGWAVAAAIVLAAAIGGYYVIRLIREKQT